MILYTLTMAKFLAGMFVVVSLLCSSLLLVGRVPYVRL